MADTFTLTGPQIANLARYYPKGADLAVRGEFTHAQNPDGTDGCLIGGELDSEPGMAGSIGMTRDTFLRLPVSQGDSEDADLERCVFCDELRAPHEFRDGLRCNYCAEEQDKDDE